jgi:photosystem I P700 chlorophyll a apoprotein A2
MSNHQQVLLFGRRGRTFVAMAASLVAVWLGTGMRTALAQSAPQETDIPGVTADLAYLRQYDGALHIGVRLHNGSGKDVSVSKALRYADVVLIDRKANRKHFAVKDANGHFLAGPIGDWNEGGRWFLKLPADSNTVMWLLFEPVTPGSKLSLQAPYLQPMDDLSVEEGPPAPGAVSTADAPGIIATVQSATRADGQLRVRLKIVNSGSRAASGAAIRYVDVYAVDPQGKRAYALLKDADGQFIAEPHSDKNEGGRWFLSAVGPNQQTFMALTFQAPPDSVGAVDLIVPRFAPFEAVAIAGQGGAEAGGIAIAGKSVELQRALKDLNAEVTPQEIKVNLSADLLFDFNKSDIKPAAEPELTKVVTVLKSYPSARVTIEGHADGKGDEAYNQKLSERRAQTVAEWLTAHAGLSAANVRTRGWGKSKPVAPNTNADGSDNPAGRAKNRRVEITVTKS